MIISAMQRAVFMTYGHGWYSHLTDGSHTKEQIEKGLEGDTLALYIFRELGDAGEEVDDAISYFNTALRDIEGVLGVLYSMEDEDE